MAEEKNNQNTAEQEKKKEEKEFLAREEVKTMKKDIAKIRETEAHQERERLAKIKTLSQTALGFSGKTVFFKASETSIPVNFLKLDAIIFNLF